MNVIPPKETLKEITKNPMAYVLFIMAVLISVFVTWAITSVDKSNANTNAYKDRQLGNCLEENRIKDSIMMAKDERYINTLLRNDSTNRALLDKPARQLLKTIEKGK